MLLYYRLLGAVALASLVLSFGLLWATISYLSETRGLALTLAGITGIIVSIGVSLDSNIVYFEHMKEDIRAGRTPRSASERSFAGAFSTVLKADLASLLGAATLFFLTTGAVRGFAFYLYASDASLPAALAKHPAAYETFGNAVTTIERPAYKNDLCNLVEMGLLGRGTILLGPWEGACATQSPLIPFPLPAQLGWVTKLINAATVQADAVVFYTSGDIAQTAALVQGIGQLLPLVASQLPAGFRGNHRRTVSVKLTATPAAIPIKQPRHWRIGAAPALARLLQGHRGAQVPEWHEHRGAPSTNQRQGNAR